MNRDYNILLSGVLSWIHNKIVIIFGLILFHNQISFCNTNILVQPDTINFNYNVNGHSDDALTIKDDQGQVITAPEYSYNGTGYNFAYVKGQTNLKIKVKFRSNLGSNDDKRMHLLINLTVIGGTGIGTLCNLFVENYSTADYLILSLQNSSVPESIGVRDFSWQWEIYAIPFDEDFCSASYTKTMTFTYYALLAQPLEPVSEPWSKVLDLACEWASGKTTEGEAVAEITTNTYNYFGQTKRYDSGTTHTQNQTFHLTNFINESLVDCQDMSAVVQVFTWMLGGTETRVRKIDSTRIDYEDICHDSIQLIGISVFSGRWYWNFHQVAWYNNKVYDACVKLNPGNPRIPVNEDIGINGSYYNDLHYSVGCQKVQSDAWVPKEPFYYTTVD